MKKIHIPFITLLTTLSIGSCTQKESSKETQGLEITNLDTTAVPGNNFYQYATGGWQKLNPIPEDKSRFGTFDQLAENNQKQIQELISELGKEPHKEGSVAQKIGTLYSLGMDSVKLNNDGATPIQNQLEIIEKIQNNEQLIAVLGALQQHTTSPYFSLAIYADLKNSSQNSLYLYQGGLHLPDRDYYLHQDEASKSIREAYKNLISTQFQNAGYSPTKSKQAAENILRLETSLASIHFPREKTRIPEENYNSILFEQLNEKVASFEWEKLFEALQIPAPKKINVAQLEPIAQTMELIKNTPIEEQKEYLLWSVINAAASYLSDNFVQTQFDFYGKKLSGVESISPRWKRVVNTVNSVLGEEVGQIYVSKYFPQEAKERMNKLVNNLMNTLSERIENLTWMSQTTKDKAQEKLSAFIVKIGYPDKWRDCSSLHIKEDSYWNNIVRSNQFEYLQEVAKLDKPVDKDEWHMSPQTVNAYYNPTTNEICFPAGILQPPFFYLHADDAINYGAIGVVIGHEMTHGFDDQGRKFDKDGNMTDWWTAEDSKQFEERAKVIEDFFNAIEVAPNVYANGKFTLGENIADHGGLQIAFAAFEKTEEFSKNMPIDGFTPAQRFFLSYANVWAGNIRDNEIIKRTKTDPHSLGKWRVNGALPHIDAWYNAFNITPQDSLFVPKEERVSIW